MNSVRTVWLTGGALALTMLLAGCSTDSSTPTPTSADSCERAVTAGYSAYELWISQGNKGTIDDFFAALVGEKGADGYSGFDGVNGKPGATGPAGASAYQIWLDQGNTGTPQDFLNSIAGATGTAGLSGLSAYQLWLSLGNTGTTQDFIDSLKGETGATGSTGPTGAAGAQGIPGICTVGDQGIAGPAGPVGPIGPSGSPGPTGATGAQGPQGIQGIQGIQGPIGLSPSQYYGSFYDTTDQMPSVINTAYAMSFNQHTPGSNGVVADGVSVQDDGTGKFSKIVFAHPGTYNVAFSAQLEKTNAGVDYASIWLSQNGSNVPWTDTEVGVDGTTRLTVAAWNFFVTTTAANEYVQLMWSSGDLHLGILAQDPVTGPVRPGIPSVILTVNQVK